MENSILLVDDEESIRTVLEISLADMGYRVLTAANGDEALSIFRNAHPPIVLTAIKMPGMDGIELFRKVKHEKPETEVIMIAGSGEMGLAIQSLKYGATDYVKKPINSDTLEIALKRAQEKIGMRQSLKEYTERDAIYDVVINDLIQESVMIITPDYRILDINETMLRKLELGREEVIGQHCYEVSHHQNKPCKGAKHHCPLKETLHTQKPSQETHIHHSKDNKEFFLSISCYPILKNGEVIAVVELSKDITKDINMQKAIMQEQKLASIGRIAAGVAHEINNPLTTILTSIMLIQEDMALEDANYQEMKTVVDETLRCRKIVSSLLDYARQTKQIKKHHDINDIVRESSALAKKQAAFKDITLEVNLSEDIPLINVDKDQIQQSVINLVLNAIEATDSGGTVTLATVFSSAAENIEIIVSDTGKGIPKEALDTIFEPFFTTKESGMGLGLAITFGIIQQHEGTIDVESEVGHGTTFTIRLPIDGGNKDGSRSTQDPGR